MNCLIYFMSNHQLVIGSLILQRNPILLRTLTAFEKTYYEYSEAIKAEKSKGYFSVSSDAEDSDKKNPNAFGIPSIPSVGDPASVDSFTDIKRFPDRKLYLLVNSRNGWVFPSWNVPKNEHSQESLRKVIEKNCNEFFKGDAELLYIGNSPLCHHLERYTDRVKPPLSSVHFFFKSQLIQGQLMVPGEYRWSTREEVKSLVPTGYWGAVKDVLSF